MSEYTIFWYWNQIIRDDTDLSTREKKEDCATVLRSTEEVISLHKRELCQLNHRFVSTAIAVLPAPLVKQGIASLK